MNTISLSNGGVQTVITPQQVVYLDFDGANTAYRGELLTIEGITVQNSGLTAAQIAALTDQLNESYWGSVSFVTGRPASGDYSTVYVGATDAFTYHGLAETIDEGNQNHRDNAFVNLRGDESLATIQQIISHEVDHLLGTLDHGGDGLAAYAYGSTYIITSGVTSSNITLSQDDSMYVLNSGVASATKIMPRGLMYISSGGRADGTTVNSFGYILINSGGVADNTTLDNYGFLKISGGIANKTIVNSNGNMFVSSGGVANSVTLNTSGFTGIYSGGIANFTTVCGGYLTIYSGGTANSTTLSGGSMSVNGCANSTILSGGYLWVSSGGAANSTTLSGGYLQVSSGGAANSTTLSGGYLLISSGGTANDTVIYTGGSMTVYANAVASQTTLSGGILTVASGGSAVNVIWTPCVGKINESTGAYITYQSNYSGCYLGANNLLQSQAATMTGKVISGSMYIFSAGTANSATINSAAAMYISSGGIASNTTDLGSMYISSGGTASRTVVNSSGKIYISNGGMADSATLSATGSMLILSGGVADNTAVSSAGCVYVCSGGAADHTAVNSNGYIYISSGGIASNTVIGYSGYMQVSSGGSAVNVIWTPCIGTIVVNNGGYVTYQSSYSGCYLGSGSTLQSQAATMSGKTVSGSMYIASGGTAYNNAVTGMMSVASAGIADSNTINRRGLMSILSGGKADNTVMNSGGSLFISSGGKITGNLTIAGGAVVSAYAGAEVNFDVTGRSVDDGYRINDLSLINGTPNYTVTVSATQSTGIYKLAQGADGFAQTISIGNGTSTLGSLTVNGAAVKYGAYKYYLLLDSGNLSLSVIGDNDIINPTITGIKVSPTDPTNQNVLVSAVFGDDRELASSQYKIGNGEWTTYTGAITVSGNATVYFKAVDTAGNETTAQYEVTNIDKLAPTVSGIKVSVSVPTNQSILVSAVFDDDRALASSLYKIGDGDWTNYTGAITVGSNGTIYFKAVDTAGNETTAQYNVTNIVDLDPKGPAAVTPTAKVNKYDVSVSWKAPAAQDKAKIVGYEVSINGERTVVKGTSLSLKAMPVSVGNTVQVRAFDSLGRYGALSDIITFDVKDVTGPTLGKVTTSLDQYTATVSYSGSDNVGVDHYQVKCGDQTQIVAGSSAVFDHLALGVNNVEVTAYDAAGNASKAVTAKITVKDVTAPDPVTGLATPTVDSKYKATLSWSAGVDNSGNIASYEIQLDNGKILKSTKTTLAVNNLAVGQHSYQVRAIDKAKNVGEWSAAMAFTVLDTTAPGTVSAKAVVAQNSITLSWKAPADNVGVTGYQVWVGASPSTMTMEQMLSADQLSSVLTDIPKGIYYMDVRAIDAAGNMSASKPVKITVSTTLPVNIALSSSSDLLHWKSHDQTSLALASSL